MLDDDGVPVGPDTLGVDATVDICDEAVGITAFTDVLCAGVSYIIA